MKGIWGFNIKSMKNLSNLLESRTEKSREKKEGREQMKQGGKEIGKEKTGSGHVWTCELDCEEG